MITDAQLISKYGQPGINQVTIDLPYPMRLAWEPHTKISKITCHKLVADQLLAIFNDLEAQYGYEKLVELGIDLYGGCFNKRLMRGSKTRWSVHSWGTAIDLDPARNSLNQHKDTAQFAKPDYLPMIAIFSKHGFEGLGPVKDYDWMHFQVKQ